jgi:lysozyme
MTPAQRVAAVVSACAFAVPLIANWEGHRSIGYADVRGIPTDCFGNTSAAMIGKKYTDDQCMNLLAQDAVSHGLDIDRCIKVPLPVESRAAFTSFAYNAGANAFCTSTMAKKLNAGDLRGACAELSKWTSAGGHVVPGLVNRRAAERAACEKGLT